MAKKTKADIEREAKAYKKLYEQTAEELREVTEDRKDWIDKYQELMSQLCDKEEAILDLRQQRLVLITNIQQDENRIHDLEIVLNIREEEIQKLQSDLFNSFNALETVVENTRNALLRPGEGQ